MIVPPVLSEALDAIRIESPSSLVWLDQRLEVPATRGDEDLLANLAADLARRLYEDFYCCGGIAPPAEADQGWTPSRVEALSAANTGKGSPNGGWVVRGRDGASIVVERDGLRLWAEPHEVIAPDARPGAQVAILRPKEWRGLDDGFYTAFGDAGDGVDAGAPLDRFYWDVRPEGRVLLVALVTARFNAAGLPFRLKVLNDPRALRCDAGVLYTPSRLRAAVTGELAGMLPGVAEHLRPAVPSLTLPLAPGLGFAEDPPGPHSFGEHRCRLLAGALVEAHRRGVGAAAERASIVAARWTQEGLSLGSSHLNPGSDPRHDPAPLA